MNIITTLIPIFTIITIGWFARTRGFMSSEFVGPANRLVYHLAIPAMIFRSISKSSLTSHLNFSVIAITLSSILIICIISRIVAICVRIERWQFGTFLQSSFHGNLGYIGLAISYYYLGDEGFVRASILAGFIIILQNVLAVFVLQFYAEERKETLHSLKGTLHSFSPFLKVLGNPVIVSAIAGILFSLTGMQIPLVIGSNSNFGFRREKILPSCQNK